MIPHRAPQRAARRIGSLAAAALLATVATACTGATPASPPAGSVEGLLVELSGLELDHDELIEALHERALAAESTVVLYATTSSPEPERLVPAFEAAFPGLRLDAVRVRSSDLAERVLAEDEAGQVQVDVVLPTSPSVAVLEDRGLLARRIEVLAPAGAGAGVVSDRSVVTAFQPYVIAWNTDRWRLVAPPTGWDDLLDPDRAGCVLPDSGLSWFAWMIRERGEEGLRAWVRALTANGGGFVVGQGSGARAAALAAGEVPCLAAHTVPSLAALRADGAPVAWTIPDGAPASVWSIAILRDTQRPAAAALLTAWLLGADAARLLADAELIPTSPSWSPTPGGEGNGGGGDASLFSRLSIPDPSEVLDLERRRAAIVPELIAESAR